MKTKITVLISCLGISGIIWLATTLNEFHEYSFVTTPHLVYIPEGLAPTNNLPEEINIKFKAQGWKLLSLITGEKPSLDIRVLNASTYQKLYTKNIVRENKWFSPEFSLVSVMPEEIELILDKRITKRVPVALKGNISYKQGYGLANKIYFSPDSVTISGSYRALLKIDSVYTKPVEMTNLWELQELELELDNKNFLLDPGIVNATLDVQQIVEREFKFRSIEVKDLPPDRTVLLMPPAIDVIISGGIKELAELDTSLIRIYLYYSDIIASPGELAKVKVEIPENLKLVSALPEKIKFIIKKF
ncbi:MAG: hypothetical protein HUU54_11620 [Ignavibacteriaceae bacterium]|nr:hypothetical protein [Ignavibacteriaceae bacterium]